jgi:hypothetical protein
MKLARTVLTLTLALGLSLAAQAKTTHLGLLSDGEVVSSRGKVDKSTLQFSDTVTFRLASESSVADIFSSVRGIANFTVELFLDGRELETFSGSPGGARSSTSFTFMPLAPSAKGDHYSLLIVGSGGRRGAYFNGLSVSAVPEADTWLMLIAGLGLVGFQLRRKQKSLPQRPID